MLSPTGAWSVKSPESPPTVRLAPELSVVREASVPRCDGLGAGGRGIVVLASVALPSGADVELGGAPHAMNANAQMPAIPR